MQTEEIVDQISALSRQLAMLRQRLTRDPVRPGTLSAAAEGLFQARMAPDSTHDLVADGPEIGGARVEFLPDGGVEAVIRQPLKTAPHLSPPAFERRFMLDLVTPGSSPWMTLRLEIGDTEFRAARSLWWELAGTATPAFDLKSYLRLYRADGTHRDHLVGQGTLYQRRGVLSAEIALSDVVDARDPETTGQALYFFLEPRAGLRLELDYLIAHVD